MALLLENIAITAMPNAQRPSPHDEDRRSCADLHQIGKGLARIFFDADATGA
jgi:hypothetical protein